MPQGQAGEWTGTQAEKALHEVGGGGGEESEQPI